MKIFINNRNWLTWPRAMAYKLAKEDHEIFFIDNASTYEPLLDWYEKQEFSVIKIPNLGSMAFWRIGLEKVIREPFVLTDPDYDLSKVPCDWDEALLEGFKYYDVPKVGLSFDESRVPQENPAYLADHFDLSPPNTGMAWSPVLENGFHGYPCDTSFAVYQPGLPFSISGIRRGFPYTGLHMPWHLTLEPTKDPTKLSTPYDHEAHYYFTHVENSSYTLVRMQDIMKIYEDRLDSSR